MATDPNAVEKHTTVDQESIKPNAEWNDLLRESVASKWDSNAAPIESSLRLHNKKKKRFKSNTKRVNWGKISMRNYEQRCGILSSAVPSNGPSLHLGRLISESTQNIDEYELEQSGKKEKIVRELKKKEKIERVKAFSPKDLEKDQLKLDNEEISSIMNSRKVTGCKCKSVFRMTKSDLIGELLKIKPNGDGYKELNKLKKKQVFEKVMGLQLEMYGRYDVCCMDSDCECFRNGIECQIDSDCCDCGGTVVYYNHLMCDEEVKLSEMKRKRKDSLSCANPFGNTLNVSVLDYTATDAMDVAETKSDDVAKRVMVETQTYVKEMIDEWNEHYDDDGSLSNDEQNIQRILTFDEQEVH